MIKKGIAEHIINNWLNGNRGDVKKIMRNKSKCFALDLVFSFVEDFNNYSYEMALHEVCDILSTLKCGASNSRAC